MNPTAIQASGQTEGRIARQCFHLLGIEVNERHLSEFFAGYIEHLEDELKKKTIELLAGAREMVHRIDKSDRAIQGLLTGNLREGARLKLENVDLWKPFPFGAFADHSDDRNELEAIPKPRMSPLRTLMSLSKACLKSEYWKYLFSIRTRLRLIRDSAPMGCLRNGLWPCSLWQG